MGERKRWEVSENRHPGLDGRPWGWLETGLPGISITWRGESGRDSAQCVADAWNASTESEG